MKWVRINPLSYKLPIAARRNTTLSIRTLRLLVANHICGLSVSLQFLWMTCTWIIFNYFAVLGQVFKELIVYHQAGSKPAHVKA
jgi:hypothetical protein